MTARVIVSDVARGDAWRILDYLERAAGTATALRYAIEFDACVDRIAEFPHAGSPRPQYGAGVRIIVIEPYLVFYEVAVSGDEAVMLRVLDGRRDITRDLLRSTPR